jgi:hypothetical protein
VDLLISRMRDITAAVFFLLVALCVGMVFAGDQLSSKTGLLFIPVRHVYFLFLLSAHSALCYCRFLAITLNFAPTFPLYLSAS